MKNHIRKQLASSGEMTFPELIKLTPNAKGDRDIYYYPDDCSLVLAENVSGAFADAIAALLADGCISFRRTSRVNAVLSGASHWTGTSSLPEARRVQKYATPRWLPLMIQYHPQE
ncbi:hypothetical protein JIN77_11400 [Verrucomicrobiaceae bacterium R5-34]|nr:hypothetical protein [Verrucomicrobiaceae bacterium R5-34]